MSRSREARILDAAGELLFVYGYRRVTIDDVARRAEVGKGTVYLHWSSKLELFATVLLREVARLVADQLAATRADPAEILLHRTMHRMFLLVMRRPLAGVFYTGDTELLVLITDTKIGLRFAAHKSAMGAPYLAALHEHGAAGRRPVRGGSGLEHRLSGATSAPPCSNARLPAGVDVDLETKADGLAQVVRRGFEPAPEADPDELDRGRGRRRRALRTAARRARHAPCPRRTSDRNHHRQPRARAERPRTSPRLLDWLTSMREEQPVWRDGTGHLAPVPARRRGGRHPATRRRSPRTPGGSSRRPGRCSGA